MAHPQIAVFARLADGGAKPVRKIEGQKTLLNRANHAIFYDEIHDEIFVPQPFAQAILTFRGGASGEEAPLRVIQGSLTGMTSLNRMTVDAVHNEIFVPNVNEQGQMEVLVFPRDANGNVAPLRVLKGSDTQLSPLSQISTSLAVDPVRNLLVAAGSQRGKNQAWFLIFNRTDQGNAKPKAVIGGPKTGFRTPAGPITVYPPRGWIIAGDQGDEAPEFDEVVNDQSYVGVWSIQENGDVPPRWRIGGPKGIFQMPHGVALDLKHKELIATDKRLNAVLTFYFPEMF